MALRIIKTLDRPHGKTIFHGIDGFPRGVGVEYHQCDHCGGEGVDYFDAEQARECPVCQGYGVIPYARRGCHS